MHLSLSFVLRCQVEWNHYIKAEKTKNRLKSILLNQDIVRHSFKIIRLKTCTTRYGMQHLAYLKVQPSLLKPNFKTLVDQKSQIIIHRQDVLVFQP